MEYKRDKNEDDIYQKGKRKSMEIIEYWVKGKRAEKS